MKTKSTELKLAICIMLRQVVFSFIGRKGVRCISARMIKDRAMHSFEEKGYLQ